MTSSKTAGGLSRFVPRLLEGWDPSAPDASFRVLDGSLCFVDISGFTALSERLSARGRIGAEELVVVLNRVFGDMLDAAYRRDGQLLKFGGDALFILFEGEGHGMRAASAAVEMQATLRLSSRIPTSVGRVPLKMSVGLHSGQIHAFRVGTAHHELIVTGPAASAVCAMEAAAEAGEVMVSGAFKQQLPKGSTRQGRAGGHLLTWRKPRLAQPASITPTRGSSRTAENVPHLLRELLAAGPVESEHRLANLAFVQFRGVDQRIETQGPSAVAEHLHEVIHTVQAECHEERVTFLSTDVTGDGGKMILTTGAPFSQEDDAGRILRVARAVLDAGTELDIRIGINEGHVFLGEIGTPYRSAFTVMGDAVNLAARLMAAAPERSCYVAPSLLSRSRTRFAATAVPPFLVKGKSQPVRAMSLGAAKGMAEESDHERLPLVGRRDELRSLIETIERDLEGEPTVATLISDQGLGKTRLVSEALDELALRSFTIRAEPYTTASAYRAFRDTARRLLGVTRADDVTMEQSILETVRSVAPALLPMAPLLGDVAHVQMSETPESALIEPQFRPARMADLVVEMLRRTLPDRTVLVVEDAQWMDEASQGLLSRIERESDVLPWAMVITRRPEPGGYRAKNPIEIELGPLPDTEVVDAINQSTDATPMRPDETAELVRRINGNPQFLNEIVHTVQRTGGIDTLPDTLESILGQRVDLLPPFARRLLRAAAVLGQSFRLKVLWQTTGDDEGHVDHATRSVLEEFLEPEGDDRFRFRQPILRDALYESLPYRRRQELHLRAGKAIEFHAGTNPAAVASALTLHFLEGRDYARAWKYGRVAGDEAKRRYANLDAAANYERAMEASRFTTADTADERYQVLMSLGEVWVLSGRIDEAIAAFHRAVKTATGPADKARAHQARAQAAGRAGSFTTAFRQIAAGRRAVSRAADAEKLHCRAGLGALAGSLRIGQQQAAPALIEAERAIEEAHAAQNQHALARALQVRGVAHIYLEGADASNSLQEALDVYRSLNDLPGVASVTNTLGAEAFFADQWDAALDFYEESQQAYLQTGDDAGAALAAANVGEILVLRRNNDEAAPLLRDASRTLRACGELEQVPFVDTQRGRALLGSGNPADALLIFDQVLDDATHLGQQRSRGEVLLLGCLSLLDLGLPDAAVSRLDEGSREEYSEMAVLVSIVRIRIALATGRRPVAEREARIALDLLHDEMHVDALDLVSLLHGYRLVAEQDSARLVVRAGKLRRALKIT